MNTDYDLIVVGCGPGGAAAAVFGVRAGLKVAVIEKETFPRYHIGESLTGTAGEILRELGVGAEMDRLQFPVKSGVKVIGKTGNEYFIPVLAQTYQVRRDAFDDMLMTCARSEGATVLSGRVDSVIMEDGKASGVRYTDANGQEQSLRSFAVIDASGTACLFSRLKLASERKYDIFGDQIAVFSQVDGALRDPGEMGDNTFIYHAEAHHWAWFIPLSPNLVSVGIVVPRDTFKRLGGKPEEVFEWGLNNINSDLGERCVGRPLTEPVRAIKDYSYRVDRFSGPGWFCIGDSHRFADPIFSFGVTASMQEARAAVNAIVAVQKGESWEQATRVYTDYSDIGQDAIFDFINYFWKFPGFFGIQMRGRFRKDVIRLFGGDMFVPNPVIEQIRGFMHDEPAMQASAE